MENNSLERDQEKIEEKNSSIYLSFIVVGLFIFVVLFGSGIVSRDQNGKFQISGLGSATQIENDVVPESGVVLPVVLGNLGSDMVSNGVIDKDKFIALYASDPALKKEAEKLLTENNRGKFKITPQNSGLILNYFWALGLGNKNEILEKGEMMDPKYGGAGRFASTGGWSIARGNAMDHYSRHQFFNLTAEQQALVDKISRNIYRPCCGNSTHFPDCNHGMGMLGFLELMASQGATENEMYKAALVLNSYWFPDTYITIAKYMGQQGTSWKKVNPMEVLGIDYSSGQGFSRISSQVAPAEGNRGGSGCGVGGAPQSAPTTNRKQSGCGI